MRGSTEKAEAALAGLDPARYAPLTEDSADVRAFLDHDLASLVENRLGIAVDPRAIEPAQREDWIARATDAGREHAPDLEMMRPHWLLDEGERVGTISVWPFVSGGGYALVTSLYMRPDRRGRGIARRALLEVTDELVAHSLGGVRLETSWTWRRTLAFYAHLGLWVRMWKRDLQLVVDARLARYDVRFDGDLARFSWRRPAQDGPWTIVAARDGDRLRIVETVARGDGGEGLGSRRARSRCTSR